MQRVILTDLDTVTSTTLRQIGSFGGGGNPPLQVDLEEGNNYIIRAYLHFQSLDALGGTRWNWTLLNGATVNTIRWYRKIFISGLLTTVEHVAMVTSFVSNGSQDGAESGTVEHIMYLHCLTGGQIGPTVSVANAGNTATVINGSFIESEVA